MLRATLNAHNALEEQEGRRFHVCEAATGDRP
jgi:hypothetical protein